MKATIIIYEQKGITPYQRTKIHRFLFGYNDHSNKGSHKYKREGVINKESGLKITKGIIIVNEGKKEIQSLLKKNGAKVKVIPINLNKSALK